MEITTNRSPRRARIEIVPLIDIIFFLLATFMLVSLSMVKNQGLSLNLPAAVSAGQLERDQSISLSVTSAGQFFLNKEELPLPLLQARLQTMVQEQPTLRVFVNGDANARFEDIVALLDLTRQLGISKVSIETRKPQAR